MKPFLTSFLAQDRKPTLSSVWVPRTAQEQSSRCGTPWSRKKHFVYLFFQLSYLPEVQQAHCFCGKALFDCLTQRLRRLGNLRERTGALGVDGAPRGAPGPSKPRVGHHLSPRVAACHATNLQSVRRGLTLSATAVRSCNLASSPSQNVPACPRIFNLEYAKGKAYLCFFLINIFMRYNLQPSGASARGEVEFA